MAVLKKIKFGTGEATPIAQTVVTAADESVLSVVGTNTGLNDDANPSYAVDVNIDGATLTKDKTGQQAVLKVGTVPAEKVSVADRAGVFTAENVETALKELKDNIAAVDGAAKSYKIVAVDNPASTSLAEYKIQEKAATGEWGDVTGSSPIVVPKDNAFVTAQLGHTGATVNQETGAITDGAATGAEVLLIEYKNGEGVYTLVEIPVGDFLRQSEFKDGLQVNDSGEVSVKVDSTSENFLTVSADGVKLAGVQDAITAAINALDFTDTPVDSQYVTKVDETDGVVSVQRANVSDAVLNGYVKGSNELPLAAGDTINQAFSKIEVSIEKNENVTAAALNDIEAKINGMDTDLTAEVNRAKSAETAIDGAVGLTKDTNGESRTYTNTGEYIGKAATNTVASDIKALDTQLKTVSDKADAIQYEVSGTTLVFYGISEKTNA